MVVERSRFVAAVPANSSLGGRATVSLKELADYPFISSPRKFTQQSESLDLFKNLGLVPGVEQETSQTNTALSLIGAGVGCGVTTATAALQRSRNVHFLHIEDDLSHTRWELAMAWRPDHSNPLTRQFIDMVGQHLAKKPQLLDAEACREWM